MSTARSLATKYDGSRLHDRRVAVAQFFAGYYHHYKMAMVLEVIGAPEDEKPGTSSEDETSTSSYSTLSNPSSEGHRIVKKENNEEEEEEQSVSSLSGNGEEEDPAPNNRRRRRPPPSDHQHNTFSGHCDVDEEKLMSDLEADKRLDWRMDPEESFSDWTIAVSVVGGHDRSEHKRKTIHYHVHRNMLSIGPKRCDYFARLFKNNKGNNKGGGSGSGFKENRSKISRVQLHPLAAKAFPILLDYLYSWDDTLDVTCKNAAALRFLGTYFG